MTSVFKSACTEGNMVAIECMMKMGLIDREIRLSKGRTPLMLAARSGQEEIFHYLRGIGCIVKVHDAGGNGVLHLACIGRNINIVRHLIESEHMGIDEKGQYGYTPFLISIIYGAGNIMKYLLSKRCNMTVTALHVASSYGHEELIEYLVTKKHFNIETRDKDGLTPVMAAARASQIKAVDILYKLGCNITARDNYNRSALHLAAAFGNVSVVKKLLSYKLSVNKRGFKGRPLLMAAVTNKNRSVFKFLLDYGCNVYERDWEGRNVLHSASSFDVPYLIEEMIVSYQFDIEARDVTGNTALACAVISGHFEPYKILIKFGANIENVGVSKDNILHVATIGGNPDIIDQILDSTPYSVNSLGNNQYTPIMYAAQTGNYEVFEKLIERGADLPKINLFFRLACIGGNDRIVNRLKQSFIGTC